MKLVKKRKNNTVKFSKHYTQLKNSKELQIIYLCSEYYN